MRRSVKATAAAVIVALTAGGCGSSTGTAHRAGPAEAEVSRCLARTLVLRPGTFVVAMTHSRRPASSTDARPAAPEAHVYQPAG